MSNAFLPAPAPQGQMGIIAVACIGIGAMVGAGIFALIGQAALVAGQHVWLSFLLGGGVALLSGYSFAKLSSRYASADGALGFYNAGLGHGVIAGTFSLVYVLTLLVAVAMVAKTFGAYAQRLLLHAEGPGLWLNVFAAGIIVLMAVVNMASAVAAGRVETLLVAVKLVILSALAVAGLATLDPAMLEPHRVVSSNTMLGAVGLTFFAYAGYGTMANAGGAVARPEVTIPRAIYLAIGITIVLYVSLAIVLLGNTTPAILAQYADTAVAQAARPIFGEAGFVAVSIGALLATASAINGTLFGALKIATGMGASGQLPKIFDMFVWRGWTHGILLSVVGVVALAVAFDLSTIANAASVTFLISYLGVHMAAWRLHRETGANRMVVGAGILTMGGVLAIFMVTLWQQQREAVWMSLALVAVAALTEMVLRRAHAHRSLQ